MTKFGFSSLSGAVLLVGIFLAGCQSADLPRPTVHGPFYQPVNHTGVQYMPSTIRRVALLPLYAGPSVVETTVSTLDAAIVSELILAQRFEVIPVTREQLLRLFGRPQYSSVEALPHDFLVTLNREFAVDSVIFVDLTDFSAYPPLTVGFRSKLAMVQDATIFWSFDASFNAGDRSVVNAARRYILGVTAADSPVDLSRGVLQSPARFAGYAASATFSTLPIIYKPVAKPLK